MKKKLFEKKPEPSPIPILLETSLSFSRFFLIFLAVFMAGVSYLSGATPAQILLRTGISILVVGLLLWTLNWRLTSNMIQAAYEAETKAKANEEKPPEEETDPASEAPFTENVQA